MHLATSQESAACVVNVYVLWTRGEKGLAVMILYLSTLTLPQKVWEVLMLLVCNFFFILSWWYWLSLCSHALVLTCGWFTRRPHRHVGSQTRHVRWWWKCHLDRPPWYCCASVPSYSSIWPPTCLKGSFIHRYAWYIYSFLCQQIRGSPCIWGCLLIICSFALICVPSFVLCTLLLTSHQSQSIIFKPHLIVGNNRIMLFPQLLNISGASNCFPSAF